MIHQSAFIHHSLCITHHASVIIHSSFIIPHSSFIIPRSSFIIYHSSFIIHSFLRFTISYPLLATAWIYMSERWLRNLPTSMPVIHSTKSRKVAPVCYDAVACTRVLRDMLENRIIFLRLHACSRAFTNSARRVSPLSWRPCRCVFLCRIYFML